MIAQFFAKRSGCKSVRAKALLAGVVALGAAFRANAAVPATLYSQAQQNFTTNTRYVTADLFTWFTANGGQLEANWRPLEGRPAWDGGVNFWKDQVKQIMSANIDTLYVHIYADNTNANNRAQRANLFTAMSQLRAQGYDVPKIAPWYDSAGYGVGQPGDPKIDLNTAAGRAKYISQFSTFYSDYFAANTDAAADSYIHKVNNKVVVNTWQNRDRVINFGGLTRADFENSLKSSFAAAHPMFNAGVHSTTLCYIDPNIGFVDEMIPQYQDTDHAVYYYPGNTNQYGVQGYFNGYKTVSIKPGFWVQNANPAGRFQARDGGIHYKNAWDTAIADRATLKHVKIESWNEYTEGSGIFRANTTPFRDPDVTANDTWSTTNDPLEYIKTTATKANAFNDTPDRNASILYHEVPATMTPGQVITVFCLTCKRFAPF